MSTSSSSKRRHAPARPHFRFRKTLTAAAVALAVGLSFYTVLAAISLSTTTPAVETFNGIGTSATATLPADFRVDRPTTVRTVGTYAAAGTATTQRGGNNLSTTAANGIYNFGAGDAATATERAIGFLSAGTGTQSGNLYAQYVNNTGGALSGLTISYDVEKYRNGSNANGFRIQMFYSTDGTNWTDAGANFLTSFAADANNNGFASAPGATVAITNQALNVAVPNGGNIYLAWNYSVASGTTTTNAQGLAVDNISVLGVAAGGGPTPTPSPTLNISDVTQSEGDAGTTNFTFNVTLTADAPTGGVTFDIATADGTAQDDNPATEDEDYVANSLTGQSIPAGQTGPYQFTVQVNGDTDGEPNETFFVNVTNITNAIAGDVQGLGTIQNDDFNLTLISMVQGSTPSGDAPSPRAGQTVTVRGVVTLLKTNGFFVQEEVGDNDSDPNTSEGIFVFTSTAPTAAVGNQVTVTGTVVEFNGLTEISTSNANVLTNSTGNSLPTAVTLTAADLPPTANRTQPQLEKYEGMRLTAASLTTTAPNDEFSDVYTVITGQPRPLREPGIPSGNPIPPDPTTGTPDCCIPIFDRNPERLKIDTNGRAGSTGEVFTSNVLITGAAGPLDYGFGEYRLINEAALVRTANMSAVPVPTPFPTEFTVAGFNIENFNNAATGGPAQRQKAALAIVRVMRLPDIIGHAEIFDLASLQALATEVNSLAVADNHPNPMYEARLIPTPVSGITQNVGFLVKTARVRIDAVTQERASSTYIRPSDGATDETHDRPPLVLRATVEPTGANKPVIAVVNHTRSFIEVELVGGDGPNARAKRKAQAEDLADLFNDLQTDNAGVPVIAVGDYNAFQFSSGYDDPISVMKGNPTPDEQIVVDGSPDLVNPDFFNLIDELPAAERYTFVFNDDKTPQVLDHVLVNTAAHDIKTRVFVARNNADFPDVPASAFANDATRPERNSDHDMPVAYFTLFAGAQAGQLLINEFRHFGPGGAEDEFVEIYNNADAEHVVAATDGSAGYSVATASNQTAGTTRFVIPNGTRIPARGYFLAVNSDGYSLAIYPSGTSRNATADQTYTDDIPVNAGLALFSTANTANFSEATRLDAVGSASESNALYKEGAGYPDITFVTTREYSFFRDLRLGVPKDTNDNAADFLYVNTDGSNDGAGGRLGAPGPQNLSSPIQRNQIIKASLIDPACSGVGTSTANPVPGQSPDGTPANVSCQNTTRDTFPFPMSATSPQGSFFIRRRFRNTTMQNVTRLRFRVVDTTASTPVGTADLRLVSSGAVSYTTTGGEVVTVQGLFLEEPPTQSLGGAFNSTVQCCTAAPAIPGARTISLAEPLAPNATIDIQFRFGVVRPGPYRFFVNVEAELDPAPVMVATPSKAGAKPTKH